MEHSLQIINDFLDKLFIYGPFWIYLALFAAAFIENIFPPFPGDFFAIAGGALAAAGRLNLFLVFIVVYLGGIISVTLVYKLGLNYGRHFFIKKNYRFFSANDIVRLENWFHKRGALILILSRFMVGARSVIALVAGIGRYEYHKMLIFASISFFLFNGLILFSSYIFVIEFETIARYFHLYEKTVWPILILAIIVFVVYKILTYRKK